MRLSAVTLINYQNINSFQEASEWTIRAGEANTLYVRLVDLEQNKLRYIPGSSPSLQVVFPSVNPANTITKVASQVSSLDGSVWSISLSSTETPSTGNVQFLLTEGENTRRFVLQQGLMVESFNQGGC